MQLEGCRALVTGASSGIGHATAAALAHRGVHVKATGLEADGLGRLTKSPAVEVLPADLGRDGELERVAAWAGDVDLLVNVAGYGAYQPLAEIRSGPAADLLRVNLVAPMCLTAALAPGMASRGRGRIVNVASIAGSIGVPHESVYSASKAGLIVFSDSVRAELIGTGVGVTVVLPAAVRTDFFAREGHRYRRRIPRPAEPGDVALRILRAIEDDTDELFVPRWIKLPSRLRGGMPSLFRRLSATEWRRQARESRL